MTPAYSTFFKELAKNNNKAWFHTHKKRYESEVKAPFVELLEQLLSVLISWDDRILPDPKKALFRINRDLRFSKDKSPYNTLMKAGFSPNGKKSIYPGYYLGIDTENIHVGGGLFMIRPPELRKVRAYIAENPQELLGITTNIDFTSNFGKLKGEKAKRLDKDLIAVAAKTDCIFNKQFYAMAEFPLEPFYNSSKLYNEILDHFKAVKPLNTYLNSVFE
ncbi:DUF2461 domain-containing protein [Maribacter sp. 2304DJ31-5]|uniref:DUF2461 domain-containing protein n=1 Tax=Maribacter sp. 2304DJ31-5 TaxID=3386273 RepID=UPI0039BD907A